MKAPSFIPGLLAAVLLCCMAPGTTAQTPAGLSIQTYAGLTITGVVGRVYTLQSTTNVSQSNGWQAITVLQLPSTPYIWVDTTAPTASQRFYRAVEGPTNLAWIPPGIFTMGSPTNELERAEHEGPQTLVTLTRGFFIGRYEVTRAEFLAVMGRNYWGTDLNPPADVMTWVTAVTYCATLTQQERERGRLPIGWRYRLPTEAEWEYACRAGTTTAFHYGTALRTGMANFVGSSEYDSGVGTIPNANGTYLERVTRVGSYLPNAWGLYDMHGNILEWCQDWFSESLPGGSVTDPQGPPSGVVRVLRGGAWFNVGGACRSAARYANDPNDPDTSFGNHGLRVVLAPDQP